MAVRFVRGRRRWGRGGVIVTELQGIGEAVGVAGSARRRSEAVKGGLRGMMNAGVLVGRWADEVEGVMLTRVSTTGAASGL